MNGKIKQKLLRYQNEISIIGSAVVWFGLWSFLKIIAAIILDKDGRRLAMADSANDGLVGIVLTVFFLALFMGIDLWMRVYVGTSARAEGKGQRKNGKKAGNLYIVFAVLMMLANITTLVSYFSVQRSNLTGYVDYIDIAVSLTVELTSAITLLEMIRAAFLIRRLRKQLMELSVRQSRRNATERGRMNE